MSLDNAIELDAALRRFDHISGLDENQLAQLAGEVSLLRAPHGSLLLALGSTDPRMLYLVEGEVKLIAGDGASHVVCHTDPAALGPVSRLRPSRYQVTALSDVSYVMIDQGLLERFAAEAHGSGVQVQEALMADDSSELLEDQATHPLMFDLFDDLNHNRVVAPSDLEVAIRVGRSLQTLENDPVRYANALAACPVLALKVVRAAMAGTARRAAVRSLKDAVVRLGLDMTYELATQCVLRESLRTPVRSVRRRMREWWERTQRVAAIAGVLARMSERFDPDFASLVGLLHSIAEPVMLGYADRHPDLADSARLDNLLYANRAHLGRILLVLWGLQRDVVEAASHCNQWQHDHPGDADYTDILLVAQWHALIGTPRQRYLPAVEQIPAFRRLGLHNASPEMSLRIIEAGRGAVDQAEAALRT